MANPALHLQQNDERSAKSEVIMLRLGHGPLFFSVRFANG